MTESETSFDPAWLYSDPFAATVEWTPLSPHAASFRTHQAVSVEPNKLVLRPTREARLVVWSFAIAPFIPIVVAAHIGQAPGSWAIRWIFFVGGLALSIAGMVLVASLQSIFLDRGMGHIVRRGVRFLKDPGIKVAIANAYAIQVIPKLAGSGADTFRALAMNVVLRDGSRTELISHSCESHLISDADRVARFIGVPLWIYEARGRPTSRF